MDRGPVSSPTRSIRLPLQIGTSALWGLTRYAASVVPGWVILLGGLLLLISPPDILEDLPTFLFILLWLMIGTAGIVFLYLSYTYREIARRERPSDVVLAADGLRVEGGPHDGLALPWNEIAADKCEIQISKEERGSFSQALAVGLLLPIIALRKKAPEFADKPKQFEVWKLRIALRDGGAKTVAEAERPIEQESLRAVLDSLRAVCGGRQGPGRLDGGAAPGGSRPKQDQEREQRAVEDAGGGGRLVCGSCGAPAVPGDADAVTCGYCGASVGVSQALRERTRAVRELAVSGAASERLITRLLDQPGARRAESLMNLAAVPMKLAWPVAFGVVFYLLIKERLGLESLLLLALFVGATLLGLFGLVRASFVDRQALRLLALELGALPPPRPGEPQQCRNCGAPLAERPGEVLAYCVYCGTASILGLDVRPQAARAREQVLSLEEALRRRSRERRLWWGLSVAAALLLAVGGGSLLGAGGWLGLWR